MNIGFLIAVLIAVSNFHDSKAAILMMQVLPHFIKILKMISKKLKNILRLNIASHSQLLKKVLALLR